MNRELFTARPRDTAGELIRYFSTLGIGASPVLDSEGTLVGMISLRDLVRARTDARVATLMSTPVTTAPSGTPIQAAARILGETGLHRLPIVDAEARVVGIVSALDIIRGLTGIPARHPDTFPHHDDETGLVWTDDHPLELDRVDVADDGPGVVAIVYGGVGLRERVVWAELTTNMRTRLMDMISTPQDQYPALRHWLDRRPLRFRAASVSDPRTGSQVVDMLQRRAGHSDLH